MKSPPIAAIRPQITSRHGHRLVDDYAWLKDKAYPQLEDEEILSYLKAENAWFDQEMARHEKRTQAIFEELKGRIKQEDESVSVEDGDFAFWTRFAAQSQYRSWWRRPVGTDRPEQLILDENVEAEGKPFFRLGGFALSPDQRLLAWSADEDGSERFRLRVRDLDTGRDSHVITANAIGDICWSADSKAIFWLEVNDQWRPWRLHLTHLDRPEDSPILYQEEDSGFFLGIGRSQDRSHIILSAGDNVTNEVYLIPTDTPSTPPRLIRPRQTGVQYHVDIGQNRLFIRTNDTHINFRIVTAPLDQPGTWSDLIPGCERDYQRGLAVFRDHLVLHVSRDGVEQIRLRDHHSGDTHDIAFPEPAYAVSLGANPEYATPVLRLIYSSLVTPGTVYDYDIAARRLITRKVEDIPSGYDASNYEMQRIMAPARDGTLIPVSIVYRKDFRKDGSGRVHLYGYGAYGIGIPPSFSASRLSLLDRGFAFAIAHIRGGDDMGYGWYLDGKKEKRTNTFHDFIDAARALIAAGFARPGHISAEGGSAGGTLMGVIANEAPDLWAAILAHVPFVDVLNTMCDDTLPLTPTEWPEWGNPITDAQAFATILSYSPYENVRAQPYPPLFVTAGLSDPRVTYWEPAKWVARLRALKRNDAPLLFKVNMDAGHGGRSGRYNALAERAREIAFLLAIFEDKE